MNIGTDCSGVGAPEQAMDNLEVPYKLVFACEKDKYARKTFAANHNPGIFFEDLTTRSHDDIEQLDIYIAGYPCQAFSNAGQTVYDPFGGLFSTAYVALEMGRKAVSVELNPEYFIDGVCHVKAMDYKLNVPTLFDLLGAGEPANEILVNEEKAA